VRLNTATLRNCSNRLNFLNAYASQYIAEGSRHCVEHVEEWPYALPFEPDDNGSSSNTIGDLSEQKRSTAGR
jgi:hypothetical protein